MEHHARHERIWRFLRPFVRLYFRISANCRVPETCELEGPLFVMCNHNTDLDPLILGTAFKHQFYYVASEHVMRSGFLSKLLAFAQPPIVRQKGGSATGTVREMLKTFKEGQSVGLFPEGNRSWDGVTRCFAPATGKLAKTSGATLVTVCLKGAYLASPRWSGARIRRGGITVEIRGVYPPEELKKMSTAEVNAIIARDIFEDAFELQRSLEKPVRYRSKAPAEHLETALCICPRCRKTGTMRSRKAELFCTECGLKVRYEKTGFFSGEDIPFDTVRDWYAWQTEEIKSLCDGTADGGLIFEDAGFRLKSVKTGVSSRDLGTGTLSLYKDALVLPDNTRIPLDELAGMAIRGSSCLFLSTEGGENYEITAPVTTSCEKYLSACMALGCSVNGT